MAIAGAEEHQRAQRAIVDQALGVPKGAVTAVVETDANANATRLGRRGKALQFGGLPRGRLLDQHMPPLGHGGTRDRGKAVMQGGDDHDLHTRRLDRRAPIGERLAARRHRGQAFRTRGLKVGASQ